MKTLLFDENLKFYTFRVITDQLLAGGHISRDEARRIEQKIKKMERQLITDNSSVTKHLRKNEKV